MYVHCVQIVVVFVRGVVFAHIETVLQGHHDQPASGRASRRKGRRAGQRAGERACVCAWWGSGPQVTSLKFGHSMAPHKQYMGNLAFGISMQENE